MAKAASSRTSKKRKVLSFSCTECDQKFKSEDTLARHKATHSDSKPFNCDVCNDGFSSAVALEEHRVKHEDNQLYECDMCRNTVQQNGSYSRHMYSQVDEFPFECPECLESFRQKPYLISHMKTHDMTPKLYHCKECPKSFCHRSGLNRHILTHISEKPYVCPICDCTFNDISSRSRHVKTHVAQCGLCRVSFRTLEDFRLHIMNIHRSNSNKKVNMEGHNSKSSENKISAPEKNSEGLVIDDGDDYGSDENSDEEMESSADENNGEFMWADNNMYNSQSFMGELSKLSDEEMKLISVDAQKNKSRKRPPTIRDLVQENSDTNKQGRNSCCICNAYFPDFISLKKHQFLFKHYFKCPRCDLTSDNFCILKYHSKICNQRAICGPCGIAFYNYEEMELHIRNVHIANEEGANRDIVIPMRLLTSKPKSLNEEKEIELEENETIQSLRSKLLANKNKIPVASQNTVNEVGKSSALANANNQVFYNSSCMQNLNSTCNTTISGNPNTSFNSPPSQNLYAQIPNKLFQLNENINMASQANIQNLLVKPVSVNSHSVAQQFVSQPTQKPDFTSDYYIAWLSEFANLCKNLEFPLTDYIYEKITLIHRSISDSLSKPTGALKQKKNYTILLDIFEVFSKIICEHLKFICDQLPE